MPNDPFEDIFKTGLQWLLKIVCSALFVLFFLILILFSGCEAVKDLSIPEEPTIWIVSEIYQPTKLEAKKFNGMVGYKMIPVNPGSVNAKPTWKVDYPGRFYVGQRVDFESIEVDSIEK